VTNILLLLQVRVIQILPKTICTVQLFYDVLTVLTIITLNCVYIRMKRSRVNDSKPRKQKILTNSQAFVVGE
jgi:hypothetical protein